MASISPLSTLADFDPEYADALVECVEQARRRYVCWRNLTAELDARATQAFAEFLVAPTGAERDAAHRRLQAAARLERRARRHREAAWRTFGVWFNRLPIASQSGSATVLLAVLPLAAVLGALLLAHDVLSHVSLVLGR